MKFSFIAAFTVVLFLQSSAQIIVQSSDIQAIFTAGKTISCQYANVPSVDIGKTGGSNIYDFSNLAFYSPYPSNVYTISQMATISGHYSVDCITFNYSTQNISTNPIFQFNNNKMLYFGQVSTVPDTEKWEYVIPQTQFVSFPAVYGTSWNDESSKVDTTYISDGRGTWKRNISTGSYNSTSTIDGYGTLIIPNHTLQCLRIKKIYSVPPDSWGEYLYITNEGGLLIVKCKANQSDTGIVQIESIVCFIGGSLTGVRNALSSAKSFSLAQNYPNPFNSSTTISFSLPMKSFVSLKVYDMIGKKVATIVYEELSAGTYSQQWVAEDLPSSAYFYRLQTSSFTQTKKLILLR